MTSLVLKQVRTRVCQEYQQHLGPLINVRTLADACMTIRRWCCTAAHALSLLHMLCHSLQPTHPPSLLCSSRRLQVNYQQLKQCSKDMSSCWQHCVMLSKPAFGFRRVWVGKSFPWWSQELTDAVQDRAHAYECCKNSGLVADWAAFKQQQKATAQLNKVADKPYKEQCQHAFTSAYRDRLNDVRERHVATCSSYMPKACWRGSL